MTLLVFRKIDTFLQALLSMTDRGGNIIKNDTTLECDQRIKQWIDNEWNGMGNSSFTMSWIRRPLR